MEVLMAIAKMKLVNIVGRLRDFDNVVRSCCINDNFHPEQSTAALEGYNEFIAIEDVSPYSSHLRMAVDIGVHSNVKLSFENFDNLGLNDEQLFKHVEQTEEEINVLNLKVRELSDTASRYEQGIIQLEHIKDFDISLDELFAFKYISIRFGKLPRDSYEKLELYSDEEKMFFFTLGEDKEYFWGFYLALKDEKEKIDEIFNSLFFERIRIMEEAHGTPPEAIVSLTELLNSAKNDLQLAEREVEEYWRAHKESFLQVYSKLRYLNDSFELRRYSSKCGDSFYIFGWVPQHEIANFKKQFEHMEFVDCIVEDEDAAESIEPPTSLVNNSVTKPFEGFVEMYGLPSYNEIDPTPIMALTYSVIFGIMFGDLGQGLIVLFVALFMKYKMKMQLGSVMIRCAVFSMIFGTMYNSIFGYDNLLPFTILPVHATENINYVLLFSIAFGFILILTCMAINIINGFKQKKIEKVLFSHNGVAGFVFYTCCVVTVFLLMMYNINILSPLFVTFLIILILVMFLKEPLSLIFERRKDWMPEKKGEFFIQTFFEMFEIMLSYLSNTISFIRVGAFILSHAGIMAAVFAISELSGSGQNPIVIVIGNLFVIALEGLIVGIQGLRLQFYEMFSRFYDGGGKQYEPVNIKYDV
jgi:V/A-type H+-transporting ATPase subunit I